MVQYYYLHDIADNYRRASLPYAVQANRSLRRLTDGLRYNDMMQTFHPPFKNKIMNEWAEELSDTLKDFRGKLLAEEIKHQYYENLLNKVDTAVLVADKAGHIEWMNQAAVTHLGQISQLPESLLKASATSDTPVIRIEQNNTVLEMAVSCTTFATQGREQQLISLKIFIRYWNAMKWRPGKS